LQKAHRQAQQGQQQQMMQPTIAIAATTAAATSKIFHHSTHRSPMGTVDGGLHFSSDSLASRLTTPACSGEVIKDSASSKTRKANFRFIIERFCSVSNATSINSSAPVRNQPPSNYLFPPAQVILIQVRTHNSVTETADGQFKLTR
jgi:hypothetical protein